MQGLGEGGGVGGVDAGIGALAGGVHLGQHGPVGVGVRTQATGPLNEVAQGPRFLAAEVAREMHRTGDGYAVPEVGGQNAHVHNVSVFQSEGGGLVCLHVHRHAVLVGNALDVQARRIGNVGVAAGVFQNGTQALVGQQFKELRTLDFALHQHAFFVRRNKHDVALLKLGVFGHFAGDQKRVEVQGFDGFAASNHLDVPEGAFEAGAARHVESVQGRGKGGKVVLAGLLHAHQGDVDGAHGAQRHGELGLAGRQGPEAVLGQVGLDFGRAVLQGQAAQRYHAGVGNGDVPVGGDFGTGAVFLAAVNKDVQHVAGAQHVVGGGGNVQRRSKVEVLLLEKVGTKHQGVQNAVLVQFAQLDGLGNGVLFFLLGHRGGGCRQASKGPFVGKNFFFRQLRYGNGRKRPFGKNVLGRCRPAQAGEGHEGQEFYGFVDHVCAFWRRRSHPSGVWTDGGGVLRK